MHKVKKRNWHDWKKKNWHDWFSIDVSKKKLMEVKCWYFQCDSIVENQDDHNDTAITNPNAIYHGSRLWQKFKTK